MDEAAHGTGSCLGTISRSYTGLAACCGSVGEPLIASCLEEVLQGIVPRVPKGQSADL
ncbi:Serine/threonine protein kinase [Giardia duodenalis]|uniref:Serine/threonine protein kinase n=1 Tax=Giardia intestinalis TaxID=5741 RepID=V6U5G9_GIAIN|nr:Serine/threonine protein kinase [Giardia intestinalis]